LNIDLLTILIGPEHHDIKLLDFNVNKKKTINFLNFQNNKPIGRLSFNVASAHLENISIKLKYLKCKITDLWQNRICFKMRYRVFPTFLFIFFKCSCLFLGIKSY